MEPRILGFWTVAFWPESEDLFTKVSLPTRVTLELALGRGLPALGHVGEAARAAVGADVWRGREYGFWRSCILSLDETTDEATFFFPTHDCDLVVVGKT